MPDDPVPTDLIDLTGISLADLVDMHESAFADSLRRILTDLDQDTGKAAGFQSSI